MTTARLIAIALTTSLLAGPAMSQQWGHAAAPMGQFEGGISLEGEEASISYGCAGFYGNVDFYAKGVQVDAGESVIRVDGQEVARGNTQYNSTSDTTTFGLNVRQEWGPDRWGAYNGVINALASGSEAVWETPSGAVFSFPLAGSAEIRSCLMK